MLMIFHLGRNLPDFFHFFFGDYDCPRYLKQLYEVTQLLHVNVVDLYRGVKTEFWCKSSGLHG